MDVVKNANLTPYNTMALNAEAAYLVHATSKEDIVSAIQFSQQQALPLYCLGGGSNVIIKNNLQALVLLVANKGIDIVSESDDDVVVRVEAGEVWDDFLRYCIEQSWYGLENLAIIPGTVGASPIQNIGAYGQEVADCIEKIHYVDVNTLRIETILNQDCAFSYRDSIFKQAYKKTAVICSVEFRLKKQYVPNLQYEALRINFQKKSHVQAQEIRRAVIDLRNSKLPHPKDLANCGSFFKNPIVNSRVVADLKLTFPTMPSFELADGTSKLAAGWLIEQAGWRGKKRGRAGMYEKQALVLVNYGGATYQELAEVIEGVKTSVRSKFGIHLEQEPIEMY